MRFVSLIVAVCAMAMATPGRASPDVDFPQLGQSYGGKVRSGPGMQYRQVGSLREGDRITIVTGTGAMMNGYEWFEIRFQNGRVGYQWGGIMCSQNRYPGILSVCRGRQAQAQNPHAQNPGPRNPQFQPSPPVTRSAAVNGHNVVQVSHSGGIFTDVGNGRWTEADNGGRVGFHFQEQNRDDWSVYLYDRSRNVSIQLDLHRRMILYGVGNAPKSNLYAITGSSARGGQRGGQTGGAAPRQPRSTTVHYTCPEGLPLVVEYVNSGNGHALFAYDSPQFIRLEQVRSGSGARYTNGRFTLHSKGNAVTIETPSGTDNCFAR